MDQPIQTRPTINYQPVVSSSIAQVGYDEATRTLGVMFNGKSIEYQYPNVDKETFEALINADSIGRYFGAHIKGLPFNNY